MTFYYESLSNLIAYGDLRTNVFHQFTQVGNAIIFSLLLEQTLVCFFFSLVFSILVHFFSRLKLSSNALQNSRLRNAYTSGSMTALQQATNIRI